MNDALAQKGSKITSKKGNEDKTKNNNKRYIRKDVVSRVILFEPGCSFFVIRNELYTN